MLYRLLLVLAVLFVGLLIALTTSSKNGWEIPNDGYKQQSGTPRRTSGQ